MIPIAIISAVLLEKYNATSSSAILSTSLDGAIVNSCGYTKQGSVVYLASPWILVLIFETILTCLILPKAIAQRIFGKTNLYDAVYFNGVRFYLFTSALSLGNIIVILYPLSPIDFKTDFVLFDRVLHAILAERLILSIRTAAAQVAVTQESTITTIDFYTPKSRYNNTL